MPKLSDVLRFKKELFFEGAVQLDWFYDPSRRESATDAFVFHGPEYFGVSQGDVTTGAHQLIDTCSFTEMIARKLYTDEDENPLVMAVAGYGSGKSHLALTLATLFSSWSADAASLRIVKNLSDADRNIASNVLRLVDRPNLVLALNGMRDFNLTYEILNSARKTLKNHNLDDSPLRDITRAHEVARSFLSRNYGYYEHEFTKIALENGIDRRGLQLKEYLEANLDSDRTVFETVNSVYQVVTSTAIRWDDGISAGDILIKLQDSFCGDRGHFNKILILFDEFGRFIEYSSEFPSQADQSALQQIFEAIQNSNRGIVFVGFIQSELKTYLARVEKSANVVRYVGRYEAGEKVYLSSNLETIFANLIERKDHKLYSAHILGSRARLQMDWDAMHKDILTWLPSAEGKSLWRQFDKFNKVVVDGTYPLHPLTTWMLANLSTWLQQRSSLSFVSSELDALGKSELAEYAALPTIYPSRLIQSDFFTELLRAEEEGRQQSEYCLLYNHVLRKHKDKCSDDLLAVLAANVILRIGRFRTKTRQEALRALSYCVPLGTQRVELAVHELESELGVISFDEAAGCFDFIEDATGASDFRRFIARQRARTNIDPQMAFHSAEVKQLIGVESPISATFAGKKGIRTQEWQYNQDIRTVADLSRETLQSLKAEWLKSTAPDKAKGRIVWVYLRPGENNSALQTLHSNMRSFNLDNSPILFLVLDDSESALLDSVRDLTMIRGFSPEDKGRFVRYIPDFEMKTARAIEDNFKKLAAKRTLVTSEGLEFINTRISEYCDKRFEEVYPEVIPFQFEGFHNKTTSPAKKLLAQIAKSILAGKMDYQSVQANSREFKNRVESVLVVNRELSWGVLTDAIQLTYPQNVKVRNIYLSLDELLAESNQVPIQELFSQYCSPPYGLNEFSLGLLVACYIAYKGPSVRIRVNNDLVKTLDWAERVFLDRGIHFPSLEGSLLVFVDAEQCSARYAKLCDLVERSSDVSEANDLSAHLEALKKEQDMPEQLLYRVQACEIMLAEATRLYRTVSTELNNLTNELHESLNSNDRQGVMKRLLSIVLKCEGRYGFIQDSAKYKYSEEQRHAFDLLAARARETVEQTFEAWLVGLKCDSVAQVSGFEGFVRGLIKLLDDAGYPQLARKTRSRLTELVDDMNHIKMLQTIRQQIETYIKDCSPSKLATYDQLSEWQRRGLELDKFITTHRNLSESEIKDYQSKIRNKLSLVEAGLAELKAQISDVYDKAFDLSAVDECHGLLAAIRAVFSRSIKAQDRDTLEAMAREIEMFLVDIDTINMKKLGRVDLRLALDGLQTKWDNFSGEIAFAPVIAAYWSENVARFDGLEQSWALQHLNHTPDSIATWGVHQCVTWQKETAVIPNFLREETIQEHQGMQSAVSKRLTDLSIEAVVTLFKNLGVRERRICLQILLAEEGSEVAVTKD